MGFFKKIWNSEKNIQQKIDLTPKLLKISEKFSRNNKVSFFFFLIFITTGFFGLFVPIIQGWLTIALAFSFLGIKPLNKWLYENKRTVSNIGTLLFTITIGFIMFTTISWGVGLSDKTPVQSIFNVINWGKSDIQEINTQAFSLVNIDYIETQQAFSLVDFDKKIFNETINEK